MPMSFEEGSERLEILNSWRIKADYWEDHVSVVEAAEAATFADALVAQLLGQAAKQ